jgi:CheY-like chemotaxis protein
MFEQYLRFAGHDVAVAATFAQAPRLAAAVHPDAIVIEYGNTRHGRRLAAAIKRNEATRGIPIIALTAPASTRRALRAGCAAALGEPCYPDVLAAEIRRLVAARLRVA